MKQRILDFCMNSIKKNEPNKYNDIQLAEIRYGLEGIYLTITKMIVIFIVSILLGIIKETILVMICYNVLRITGFGFHATKSWICLVVSTIILIGGPLVAIHLQFSLLLKIFLCCFCVISFYLFAPADTPKHPIIKINRRKIYKFTTILISLIYCFLVLYIKDNFISNLFLISMIIETILILPITYKLFKLPYDNYIDYILKNNPVI